MVNLIRCRLAFLAAVSEEIGVNRRKVGCLIPVCGSSSPGSFCTVARRLQGCLRSLRWLGRRLAPRECSIGKASQGIRRSLGRCPASTQRCGFDLGRRPGGDDLSAEADPFDLLNWSTLWRSPGSRPGARRRLRR
jgi:hypothetical protein